MRLALIHTPPGAASPPTGATAWRTCLREIHFLSADHGARGADVLTDAEAYALLLEVVCGLRSPLLGETEVQAQFKAFLAAGPNPGQGWLRTLGQRVLGDAKRIRHRHLQGFGAHSYGHLVARYLTTGRVAVIGTGALARHVIESAPATASVDVWGRRADRLEAIRREPLRRSLISEAPRTVPTCDATSIVIAAPVRGADLDAVARCYTTILTVIDLRAEDEQTPVPVRAIVIRLSDLFDVGGRANVGAASRLRAARTEIRAMAAAFVNREELRPHGWDDVCA